jgi:hypothetical protein
MDQYRERSRWLDYFDIAKIKNWPDFKVDNGIETIIPIRERTSI